MSILSRSDTRKTKELKVLKLCDQGYSYRKIAKEVHVSLREVSKYVNRFSNTRKSPSTTSVMDEVVLEYRVVGLKCEVRDLESRRENLKNEVNDLGAQKYDLLNQVRVRQSEVDEVIKQKLDAIIHDKNLIFVISFFAITEALRNHPANKSLLVNMIISQGLDDDSSGIENLKSSKFATYYYNILLTLYDMYLAKVLEIVKGEIRKSYPLTYSHLT